MTAARYDAWRLQGPEEPHEIGMEEGDDCGRYHEPDEDAPRGYKPKPCGGAMHFRDVEGCSCHICPPCGACVSNPLVCDTCGEIAEW